MERTSLNGQVGLVIRNGAVIDTVILFHTAKGIAQRLYFIRNPDKLARIGQ